MTKACNDQAVRGLEPDDPPSNVTPRKSRSGKWRAAALLAVHVAIAIHIAHWWKSGSTLTPLEPSESMEFSKRGLVNAGAIFFALTIMSTAIFGRFFCGWACHLVALQGMGLIQQMFMNPDSAHILEIMPSDRLQSEYYWQGWTLGVRYYDVITGSGMRSDGKYRVDPARVEQAVEQMLALPATC